jgi:ribosome-associated protein
VIERWRERLMAHDDALTQLIHEHPAADAQHLRALIRGARKDAAEARPPRHLRELFQALKSLIEG